MKEKYQVLHLTPATSPPDTLRPGRPKDPIPRGVCLAASAPFDRREARIRENNGKKSEGTPYWYGTKLLREQQTPFAVVGRRGHRSCGKGQRPSRFKREVVLKASMVELYRNEFRNLLEQPMEELEVHSLPSVIVKEANESMN